MNILNMYVLQCILCASEQIYIWRFTGKKLGAKEGLKKSSISSIMLYTGLYVCELTSTWFWTDINVTLHKGLMSLHTHHKTMYPGD